MNSCGVSTNLDFQLMCAGRELYVGQFPPREYGGLGYYTFNTSLAKFVCLGELPEELNGYQFHFPDTMFSDYDSLHEFHFDGMENPQTLYFDGDPWYTASFFHRGDAPPIVSEGSS